MFNCFLAFISLTLSHATTPEELRWGLMQRTELLDNEALLLHYPKPQMVNIWAFNCFVDLDVAFLDKEKTIVQLGFLKAYPDKMRRRAPITTLKALDAYPEDDPLLRFFQARGLSSLQPVAYVLELPAGFFKKHDIRVGNKLVFNEESAYIIPGN